jgi:uncharacterized repeat protein (TIGR03803 family)
MSKFNWRNPVTKTCAVSLLWASAAVTLPAQTLTVLHSFDQTDGQAPNASLAQAVDGSLYGTTVVGGTGGVCNGVGCGTLFKITIGGTLTSLHSFGFADGAYPMGGLAQATGGDFYGTVESGGTSDHGGIPEAAPNGGTVFEINLGDTLTTLYPFCAMGPPCKTGATPYAGLVLATDGNFYGTTQYGGANGQNAGTVFKISSTGAFTLLHSFSGLDGEFPFAGLVQATDGNFYGTTGAEGAHRGGTVFKITPGGAFTTLHNFDGTDGDSAFAGLVQGADGNFYGTTTFGGNGICISNGCGTVFKITPTGMLTTLHRFDGTDGAFPSATLVQGTDGNFYGTTQDGGTTSISCPSGTHTGCGTVFRITPSGTLTSLYSFCLQNNCADGANPIGGLIQATDGNFYGTTAVGGTSSVCGPSGCGTIFSLSLGRGPFVETQPTSGKVGAGVKILGTNLTAATSVTFNGTAATFTVVSSSYIKTTVPAGATTGIVEVVTPAGTLKSNVPFRVLP